MRELYARLIDVNQDVNGNLWKMFNYNRFDLVMKSEKDDAAK